MDAFRLLSVSVTPVVLISACGLVILALYNRLGTILARIRAFYQQKIEMVTSLDQAKGTAHEFLLEMLDSQIAKVTAKAKAIQKGLYCLLAAILAFLICSLLGAATVFHESVGMIALGMHVLGLLLFFAGICWAIWELRLSLTPLDEERAYLEIWTAHQVAMSKRHQQIKIANLP